jgi:hypothetical protein
MANNPDGDIREPYFEIPSSKYLWLWGKPGKGTAIPINFTKYYTCVLIVGTFIATTILWLTNWWQIILTQIATFFYITYWPIGWGGTAITVTILYMLYKRRQKRLLKERKYLAWKQRVERATVKLAEEGVNTKNE